MQKIESIEEWTNGPIYKCRLERKYLEQFIMEWELQPCLSCPQVFDHLVPHHFGYPAILGALRSLGW